LIDGLFVVPDARPVRGADLPQTRSAASHDFGNTKGVPDLDLLSPGHDDFAALTQGIQHQKHRRRIVIYNDGGLAAEQLAECPVNMRITPSTFTLFDIEFEVRITGGHLAQLLDGALRQWRPSEVRM